MHSDTVIEACESQVALQEDLCASERDPGKHLQKIMATQQAWHHRMDWRCSIHPELGDENQKKQFVHQRQRSS